MNAPPVESRAPTREECLTELADFLIEVAAELAEATPAA